MNEENNQSYGPQVPPVSQGVPPGYTPQSPGYTPYTASPVTTKGAMPPPGYKQKSKIAAGILGILLGGLGIHNFYLGNTSRGLIQLLVALIGGALTCGLAAIGMEIWGLVEGIQILTGNISTDSNGVLLGD